MLGVGGNWEVIGMGWGEKDGLDFGRVGGVRMR